MNKITELEWLKKTLGPGILFASTAIGVSHLVQSTRAGASYGFGLLFFIIIANLFKYPFFEFASRYANSTETSIIDGYKKLGSWVLWSYLIITLISMFFITSAVGAVTSGFLQNLFQTTGYGIWNHIILFLVCGSILSFGKYDSLDSLIKIIGFTLLVSTLLAFILVLFKGPASSTLFPPIEYNKTDFLFIIALMGCMVGPKTDALAKRFPYVDVFMRPQQFDPLLEIVGERTGVDWEGCVGPLTPVRPDITCHVPIIHGCDLMCTFCIIPYRRGRQVSRSIAEIALEVETLVSKGVKEVTLLGQTVDAYGYDLPDKPNLADLFARLDQIDGIERIRFLTSHPKFMTQEIIQAVADEPKVCEHKNLPVQAGDDEILYEMRRQYSRQDYIDLVGRIREAMPDVALNTDIIVGFPGETEEQFQHCLLYTSPSPRD